MKLFIGVVLSLSCLASYASPSSEVLRASVEKAAEEVVSNNPMPAMHAMREPKENIEDARLKINAWIRYNFQKAFMYKSKGDTEYAFFHYFMARHTLRDSTSPLSNDQKGNPAIFSAKQSPKHIEQSEHSWRDKVDEDTQLMFDNNFVPGGDLLRMYGIDTENGPVDRPDQTPRPNIVKE